ncbi:hypothetical protein TSUD_67900 [Trifolium subterraneum]|uniref:Uncharacterized protein n=1 Tax=Trifolium subterraneum TaxID=3900 RepID=A0A2Z6MEJ1_TRISU|nr:hypothetical protein TSUD_67900 [Trifolium subterraneum]
MDMVTCMREGMENEKEEEKREDFEEGEEGDTMRVVENTIGGYACPEFVFSKSEEKRIYRPWRRGLSHEEDQYAALMDEPWFIYDHYLTVKEWSPNFHPTSDTIKEVAVWVRIAGLPIEYYDSRILN